MKNGLIIGASLAISIIATSAITSQTTAKNAEASASSSASASSISSTTERCFHADQIRNFDVVDIHSVRVTDDWGRNYLLRVDGACFNLDSAMQIGIRSRHGELPICGAFDGEILYRDPGMGRVQSCTITDVTAEGKPAAGVKDSGKDSGKDIGKSSSSAAHSSQ